MDFFIKMAELKTALTSKITSNNDTRDYDFGRVGNTNYVYINNEKSMKIPNKAEGRITKNYKSNNSRYYKSRNDYGNNGFYSSNFPYCFMDKAKWGSTFTNPDNCSNIGIFQDKCINGATWEYWNIGKYPEDDKAFLNSSEYQASRIYNQTGEYGETLYGRNFYWDPLWWKSTPDAIQYGSEPWTRLKFPLKDMLDIPDDQVDTWLQENQITRVNGFCKMHCNNNNTDGYYLSFNIRTVCSLDESGWNRKWDYPIMYWSANTSNAAEDLSQNVNFNIPIIDGQKNIFLEIIGFTDSRAQWFFSQTIPWTLEVKFTELFYRPKFQGNIFTAPNNETLFCTGTANTGSNDTIVNFLGGSVENRQVWPKEYLNSNVNEIKLNSSVTSTIIKSNPANTNTAFEIYLNWLTGEYQGYYQNSTGSYSLTSTQGENFDVGNDSSFTLKFGSGSTNNLTIKPQSKTITELPVVISGGKAELTIKNFLNNVTALIDRQNIEDRLEEIQTAIRKTQSSINKVYIAKEVGDYYITESNINPAIRFGGTWKLVTDRLLLGASSENFKDIGSEGGSDKLTIDQMPAHNHNVIPAIGNNSWIGNRNGQTKLGWENAGNRVTTEIVGGNKPHKHPYRYVYLWRKVSNDKDPLTPQSFTTQSANVTYTVALEQFPVGYIYRKDVAPTTPPTIEDNWLPCNGGTVLLNGEVGDNQNKFVGEKYKELIRLLTGSDTAISATLPLLNQNDNIGTEKITYDGATFNTLFPENKRPKYWIKAANSVRQTSLPNLIDHSLNIHYYGENNKGLAPNLKNLSKNVTAKRRGSDNFFLDSGNLNIDPNKFKKSIITIKAYDSARNCIMYRFDIDWQLKTLQFFTDDYTATEYLSAGINSPWTYNLTTNNRFKPIKGDTKRYLEFDNKGYIKTLPLPPFSNISTLDVMCENYKC